MNTQSNLSLYSTSAVIILDADGHRVLAKYYEPGDAKAGAVSAPPSPFKTLKEQHAFEQGIWEKSRKPAPAGDVILYSNQLVLFRASMDVTLYVVGPEQENELMLNGVMVALYEALLILLKHSVEKRSILEKLDLVMLCLDETIDQGIILETDSDAIAARVSKATAENTVDFSSLNEQTLMSALSPLLRKGVSSILQNS